MADVKGFEVSWLLFLTQLSQSSPSIMTTMAPAAT
jgi:hypothetical protein